MAFLDALVTKTLESLSARHSAAEGVFRARNRLSLLMFAVAVFGRQEDARRAFRFRVAEMLHRMAALVRPSAWILAFWNSSSARHWRIDDSCSAFATKFIERDSWTRQAVADVARLRTFVLLALELTATNVRADVIELDAAALVAFVLSTGSELRALFLATDVSAEQVLACDFLFDSAAAALDVSGLGAGRAVAEMTSLCAGVRSRQWTALQCFCANSFAQRDRIVAVFSVTGCDVSSSTRTSLHSLRRQRAAGTALRVALLLAAMVLAAEKLVAFLLAGIFGD